MKKVLIIVGDASETLDTLYPFYRLQEAGIEPVVAGPEKKTYQMVMHEVKPGWTITKEWEGYTIEAKIAFKGVVESEYDGIFFPEEGLPSTSGRTPISSVSPNIFRQKPTDCQRLPWGGNPRPGRSRHGARMATVPKCKFDLEICGGTFVDEPCVVDGNLVSGRTFHDNGHYFGKFIELLAD